MRNMILAGSIAGMGITGGAGFVAGQSSVKQRVIIRAESEQVLNEKPVNYKLQKQLEEAGIEVIYDSIVTIDR